MKLRATFRSTEKTQPNDLVLRECRQWDPNLEYYWHIRYDFAYRDPANGRYLQYGVDVLIEENATNSMIDLMCVEPAKAKIAHMLRRKCGLDYAVANQILLQLPGTVPGRFV